MIPSTSQDVKSLILYLKSQNISIDFEEFQYQIETHPDFPSLLAFADALTFFRVNYFIGRDTIDEIKEHVNNFIGLFSNDKDADFLGFTQIDDQKITVNGKKKVYTNAIKEYKGVFLVAEKTNEYEDVQSKSNYFAPLSISIFSLTSLFIFLFQKGILPDFFFLSTSILGLIISIEIFRQFLGIRSSVSSKFCNINAKSSCEFILHSKKWKIFNILNLSDICIIYFFFSTIALITFALTGSPDFFIFFFKHVFIAIIPISLASIYYQWKVERKWCPLCLSIICLLYIQASLLYFFPANDYPIFGTDSILLSSILLLSISIWYFLKPILLKNKNLQESNIKTLRFKRNYEIFKRNLLDSQKVEFPQNSYSIILGNQNAPARLTIISSVFCGHCKNSHRILTSILNRHQKDVSLQIIFVVNKKNTTVDEFKLYKKFHSILIEKGETEFTKELIDFSKKDYSSILSWVEDYHVQKENEIYEIMKLQNQVIIDHKVTFTPVIFINGYKYPSLYEKDDLEFFIPELIEDNI